ncbi:MAG: DNA polymerase III subunit delta [Gammaproteobacteria bacterium]|nr:DNA polymerase III subunit delta [Gammaproteobacteria bacterium]
MRLDLTSLSSHLKQGLHPLYLLFGPEILLVEEALDQIRARARDDGYLERLRFTAEAGFDWKQLGSYSGTLSLFAEKRLIELRIPSGKPGKPGAQALTEYVGQGMPDDTSLVIIGGHLDKPAQNSRWFKTVSAVATVIECPAIGTAKLPGWINQRMSRKGLKFEPEAVERLSYFVEGNLLAAAQEINLLALLHADRVITVEIIENVIADHARFNVYSLADACLAGSAQRAVRILHSLRSEQVEPIFVLWALARETRTLCQLSAAAESGTNPQSLFTRYRIWASRSALVKAALGRFNRFHWENILRRLGQADLMAKGSVPLKRKDIWEEIESISLGMCGTRSR